MTTFTTEDRENAEPIPFAGWVNYSRAEVLEETVRQLLDENHRLTTLVEALSLDLAFYKKEL